MFNPITTPLMWQDDKFMSVNHMEYMALNSYIILATKKPQEIKANYDVIKHIIVTEKYRTIQSLADSYFNLHRELRMQEIPPLELIEEIYNNVRSF